jgi:hypothetical protein
MEVLNGDALMVQMTKEEKLEKNLITVNLLITEQKE